MLAKLLPFGITVLRFRNVSSLSLQQLLKWRASNPPPMSSPHLDDAEAGTAGSSQVINQPQINDEHKSPLKNGPVLRIRRSPPGQNGTAESVRGAAGRQTAASPEGADSVGNNLVALTTKQTPVKYAGLMYAWGDSAVAPHDGRSGRSE